MILDDIYTALQGLVSARVYPAVAPIGTSDLGDYIVYTPIGGAPQNTLGNGATATQMRLQVDVFAKTAKDAWTVNAAADAALRSALSANGITAPQILFEEETRLYRVHQDFHLFY